MPLLARIHDIYARHPHHIHPFVGAGFESPDAARLRVLAVGINAYVAAKDWETTKPEWFSGWIENQTYRFGKGIVRAATTLGRALSEPDQIFAGRRFDGLASLYVTNAVKVFVPEASGKKAAQISDADFDRHADQWRDELLAMRDHDALPHVVIVFGEPFWGRAWRTFHPNEGDAFEVARYTPAEGAALHHANRIRLRALDGEHELLLVRLRHPAARTKLGSAPWLLRDEGFRALTTTT